jgi:hypothetical protein
LASSSRPTLALITLRSVIVMAVSPMNRPERCASPMATRPGLCPHQTHGDNDPARLLGHSSVRHIAFQRKNHAGSLFRDRYSGIVIPLFRWIVIRARTGGTVRWCHCTRNRPKNCLSRPRVPPIPPAAPG